MNYKTFLKSIEKILDSIEASAVNDEDRANNIKQSWALGREVYAYKQKTGITSKHIADDLGVTSATMDKYIRIYRMYPEDIKTEIDGKPITWSHYQAIMHVHSEAEREFYLKEIAKAGWSSHQLRRSIRNNYYENRLISAASAKGAKARKNALRDLNQKFYTYTAKVLEVTDGDTLLLDIDVGFKTKMEHKVRFRGINCAEVTTPLGDKAKAFVQEQLLNPEKANAVVAVRSYKSGKFGRYIVDVWYMPQETNQERILAEGRFLNQELLDEGLAVLME